MSFWAGLGTWIPLDEIEGATPIDAFEKWEKGYRRDMAARGCMLSEETYQLPGHGDPDA
jgi:hypothetical protein